MKKEKPIKTPRTIRTKKKGSKDWIFQYDIFMNYSNKWVTFTKKYHKEEDAIKAKKSFLSGAGIWRGILGHNKVMNVIVKKIN